MKKLISLVLMITMIVSLAACGKKNDANDTEGNTNNDESPITTTVPVSEGDDNTSDKLIMATEPGFPPYEYMEGEAIVGIDVDIAKEIAEAMGKELEIKSMDFDGALAAVKSGKVDFVAAGLSVDEERAKVMDFSIEYATSTVVVVVNKETPAVSSVDDLTGKVIGVQLGNTADYYVSDEVDAKEVKRYDKFLQAAEDLKNNRIDCIVMDSFPAQELVNANEELALIDGALFEDKYAIAVTKGSTELLEQINNVLNQLIADGKIEEFTANHVGIK